jgi:CDGSH-type Zn-finger protein
MDQPKRAADAPFAVEVKQGNAYFWCACGLSATQPFCDGSHKDSGFSPVKLEISETTKVWLCGCKHSADKPFCDGSHKGL